MHYIIGGCIIFAMLLACAPSQASLIRDQKPITIGFTGASVRPWNNIAVGATFADVGTSTMRSGGSDQTSNTKF